MTSRIDNMYMKVDDALSRLSLFDNHWTFDKIPSAGRQYIAKYHDHEEAKLVIDVDKDNLVNIHVYDIGLVRFNDGSRVFVRYMPATLTEEEENDWLNENVITTLNDLHGV